jgi:predicted nucleic acid-binding protein
MWVFDATPLIYLGKVDRLGIVAGLDRDRLIPERVYEEVVTEGIEGGYPDARRVERAVEDGLFSVREVEEGAVFERLRRNPNLSGADVAVLSLADELDGVAVMDERYGRDVADTEGIETRGTAYLVGLLVKRGELPAAEGRAIVDGMVEAGWHCSPALYARLVRTFEE